MSLFPAYNPSKLQDESDKGSSECSQKESTSKHQELSWLKNTSYPSTDINQKHGDERKLSEDLKLVRKRCVKDETPKSIHKKKKKKDKKEKTTRCKESGNIQRSSTHSRILENDQFYEDKKQERGNLLVETLYRPAIPRYDKYNRYFKKYRYLKKKYKKDKKVRRYFIVSSMKSEGKSEDYDNDPSTKEEELTKVTEDFNKRLADNPRDVDVWLEYVKFQDTVYEFEKTYRKNASGGEQVTSERKLAILDRAIQNNPASEQLIAERLELTEQVRPADQLAEECTRLLTQDPGNMALWRALVRTTRNNMARCTTPGVLQLFSKAITRISQLRLHRQPVAVEQDILSLLLECGLFLQQAGLWEQLWALLHMYLSLSLTASGQFHVPFQPEEDNLREQEDRVVASGLPLSELWLRVEKLRAAYHFLPDNDCDSDPQRVVFSDDMSGLLQPVMSPELRLRLVVTTAFLLKVPLLPTRHSLLHCLGLLDVPSAVNNCETLLAALYSTGIPSSSHCRYLSGATDLLSEPQCVKNQHFLSWVVSVLQLTADLLPTADAAILHSWTLRLYGLLCRLHSQGLGGVSAAILKQAKSHAKQLLKLPKYRDNLILYTEYAVIEREAGDLLKACKVLEIAASTLQTSASEQEVSRTFLCRRLTECLLMKDPVAEKEHAIRVLISLAERQVISSAPVSNVTIKRSVANWHQQSSELAEHYILQAGQSLTVAAAMTPQLIVEWLACHTLLLSLTHSIWDATALLQRHIDLIPHAPNTLGSLWVEQLYEVLVDTLYRHTFLTHTSFDLLRNTLVKALSCFPNNLSLLNTLATIETGSGGGGSPMWRLTRFFPASSPLARLVLVFVLRCRVSSVCTDEAGISTSGSNYLRNLLRQLTEEKTSGQCPLMWRLYLQLVAATDSPSRVKEIFYKCLQACPWVKDFYFDAVKFLPEELSEVQDLMIEKELRLHTSPEELEILRD